MSRETCNSRNTRDSTPCRLPRRSCPHPRHRVPDVGSKEPQSGLTFQSRDEPPISSGLRSPAGTQPSLLSENRLLFRDLMESAALSGGLTEDFVERDYWMFQVSRCLLGESKKYPGSFTCMGGGSMLALTGIVERVSEDADFSASYVDGAESCTSNKGKRLMAEYQRRVTDVLGLEAKRVGSGGGNFFRTVHYHYESVCEPNEVGAIRWVESDMGIRDTDPEFMVSMPAKPYLTRFAESEGIEITVDLKEREFICSHPLSVLVDKLDSVCWREQEASNGGTKALEMLANRVRDHYDIYKLIGWLAERGELDRERVLAAVAHMRRSDLAIRKRRRVNRPQHDRPTEGYHSLRAWTPGTVEYETIQKAYPALESIVYGDLPDNAEVAKRIRSCAEAL